MGCVIGIPAWNEESTLPALLSSLWLEVAGAEKKFHIIVVANGCTDDTVPAALAFGEANWGSPRREARGRQRWWHFGGLELRYSVCETAVARKSHALNVIHFHARSERVLLFDADVTPGIGSVTSMDRALAEHPEYGAVAVRYVGRVPAVEPDYGTIREYCRVCACRAINHFDRTCPRLDGKALGYRRALIDRHPSLIAVDMWLEGMAWDRSAGCLYLSDVEVGYLLPRTLDELIAQYARYDRSIRFLALRHPRLVARLRDGRRRSQAADRHPDLVFRIVGRLFLQWVHIQAIRNAPHVEEETWQRIESTRP